jgi:hypothetical protein
MYNTNRLLKRLLIVSLVVTTTLGLLAYLDYFWFGYFVIMIPVTLAIELLRRV